MEGYQAERKQRQTQQRVEQAFNAAKGNPEKAADLLETQGDFLSARTLRDKASDIRRQTVSQVSERLNQHKTLFGQGAQFLKEVEAKPELYADLRPRLVDIATALDPRLANEIPEQYEPEKVRGMLQFVEGGAVIADSRARAAATAKAALDQRDARIKDLDAGRKIVSDWFSVSDSQEDWDVSHGAMKGLVPDEVLTTVGPTWSKEAQERARQMGLTPAQKGTETRTRVDDTRADEAAAETRRHNAAMEGIGRQREARLSRQERDGTTPTGRATAERWKASQLEALEKEASDALSQLTTDDVRRRQLQIENSYRAQIGLKPLPSLPASWGGQAESSPTVQTQPPTAVTTPTAADFKFSAATPDGSVTVTAPDGTSATFKTRAEADAAIADFLAQSR